MLSMDFTGNTYESRVNEVISEYSAKELLEDYLNGKDINVEIKNGYGKIFAGSIIENILIYHFKEVDTDKIIKAFRIEAKKDINMVNSLLNVVFKHNEIDLDHDLVCKIIAPVIQPNRIFVSTPGELLRTEQTFAIPYFKSIIDIIKKDEAYAFKGFILLYGKNISREAILYMVDNNKYVREVFDADPEMAVEYPSKNVREIFVF